VSDEVRNALAGVDTSVANIARIHDYLLGGKDNYAADREAVRKILAIAPDLRTNAIEGQAFRGRLVRYLAGQGVSQFITLGAGMPAPSNIHALARSIDPQARTVYVDDDTVALNHARAILASDPGTAVVRGDVLHPEGFLTDPALRRLIDFDRPLAVLILTILQYIPDVDGPYESVARLRECLPSGAYLAITHIVFDGEPEAAARLTDVFQQILGRAEEAPRTLAQVGRFFDGLDLVDPGVVHLRHWHPDGPAPFPKARPWSAAGVARKP
jgi:hypothetical protein